jgi:hypothetical protein
MTRVEFVRAMCGTRGVATRLEPLLVRSSDVLHAQRAQRVLLICEKQQWDVQGLGCRKDGV